ncbi:TonB-dependent receptor [Oxalobacteraceae bacterium OTU3REALA1]|nr:TonB-dependent receptor [Oxalobacteraceae bacterium OTU3REALA1]
MKQFKKTAIALGLAQMAMMASSASHAQTAPAPAAPTTTPAAEPVAVVITGQRAALQSAQKIKQNSDEVVDSIAADDIGKLPDRSVTEVLQRVAGVTIDRTMSKSDPEHFSVEGSGVSIRGLSYVRSELNGRDSFSANGGRSLNFGDVPPELLAGVDIYKNPSAEQTEGGIGGLVNLRTAMPFDFKGFHGALSAETTYSELKKGKKSPSYSGLVSNRWKTPFGEIGALVDLAYSESDTRTDAIQVEPYYPFIDANGKTTYVPKGAQWRTLQFDRKREGAYGALQWKLDSTLSSSLTYFKSKYKMTWDEQAIFSAANVSSLGVSNGVYDSNGRLMSGTLTSTGGIDFGNDNRTATRNSDTTDISWNLRWRPSDAWTVTTDLQRVRANTNSLDSTVATAVKMPSQKLDLTGSLPNLIFNDADRAALLDPRNNYWNFTQEHLDRSKGKETAWRTDATYQFDNPVLRDFRFGVRLTDREAVSQKSNPDYNWAAISAPWQVGTGPGQITSEAFLSDPRFAGSTTIKNFDNFFNGKMNMPSLIIPASSTSAGYPNSYAALHAFHDQLCAQPGTCTPWKAATFGTDPQGTNEQSEKTQAAYGQLRFGWDQLKFPIDGNVGLRYVKTDSKAAGYTVYNPPSGQPAPGSYTGETIPVIAAYAQAQTFENRYHNFLPSLNLRLKASDALQFRFAFASAMSRPDYDQMQAYTSLSTGYNTTTIGGVTNVSNVALTGTAAGNPNLRPTTSKQLDLTAEWYFSPVGSLTLAVFNKRLKDIVVNQTYNFALADTSGTLQNFSATGPINGARGHARGFELAYQQTFDKLPGLLSGLGMQANFTFVDSKRDLYKNVFSAYCSSDSSAANVNLNINGCDTNGRAFGNLPLENLSRQSFNIAVIYDQGPFSSRLAYNWRSKSLQGVNVNGTKGTDGVDTNPASATVGQRNIVWGLPTWADDYGQLDGSINYKISDNLSLGLEAQNLTDAKFKQLMQQTTGMNGRAWFVTGRRYTAQLRYTF